MNNRSQPAIAPLAEREEVRGLRATIDVAPIGIAHFALDGRFLLANARLCEMLGCAHDELLRKTFQAVTFPEDLERCMALNREIAAGQRQSYGIEKRFLRPDGSRIWARVNVSAVHDPRGQVAFFIGVAADTTEQHVAEEERERLLERERVARERSERAMLARDEMVSIVAHDLRNPLHAIQEEAARLRSDMIQRAAAGMELLLNDLLDISRIEARMFAVARNPLDVGAVLSDTRDALTPSAAERKVRLDVRAPSAAVAMTGDAARLGQAISNLVEHALKHAPQGGSVVVDTRMASDHVEFTVHDSRDVPADRLLHLFDRYWQSDRTTRVGAALGLPIAKGIVEAHGGRIWAESAPGRGTTVRFTLPLIPQQASP